MNADAERSVGSRRQWVWYLSALVYRWTDTAPSKSVDDAIIHFLGQRIRTSRVLDCGCGPGGLSETFLTRGAPRVVAVDANPAMVRQATTRLEDAAIAGRVEVRRAYVDPEFFASLGEQFDVILFKRSLYANATTAVATVRAALSALAPGGVVIVAQPERRLRRYALGPERPWLQPHSAYHVVNRLLSRIAVVVGISDYRDLTERELIGLLRRATADEQIVTVPSEQWAYNVVAITVSSHRCGTGDTAAPAIG